MGSLIVNFLCSVPQSQYYITCSVLSLLCQKLPLKVWYHLTNITTNDVQWMILKKIPVNVTTRSVPPSISLEEVLHTCVSMIMITSSCAAINGAQLSSCKTYRYSTNSPTQTLDVELKGGSNTEHWAEMFWQSLEARRSNINTSSYLPWFWQSRARLLSCFATSGWSLPRT